MHRWLALLAVLYGLLGLWAMLHPRPRPEQPVGALEPGREGPAGQYDAAPGEEFAPEAGGWPAEGPGPQDGASGQAGGRDAFPDALGGAEPLDLVAPDQLDFESGLPSYRARPDADVTLQDDGGGSFLSWLFSAARDPVHMLLLPIKAPGPDQGRLRLRLRAEGTRTVMLGLRLEDGRTLLQRAEVTDEWQELELPLGEFHDGGPGQPGRGRRGGPPRGQDTKGQPPDGDPMGRPPQHGDRQGPPPGERRGQAEPPDLSQLRGIELRVFFPPEGGPAPERVLVELDDLRFEH